ncbi:GTPase-activating Rap/Ran-GAP domain-like protein 3 isoform X4 [Willisornis vidua]|uniref:GTPase-activating Rap/Ran-GAP domain-like protein 3 isoform X4 n=1 Tax=Willisornis vidua TaxID=1566151 RepID=A0ABQ9D5T8_9PASS|nr:GTPase-activating Rap/Ran-GAP domain-like protein 3 isoform X4 [Willisornis vidua]
MELSSAEAASTRFLGLTQRSVSEDLGCRRGEFSRKHYGSVELLISSDADGAIQRAGRFRVENGSSGEGTQKICLPYSPTKTLSVKSILSAMSLDKFEKSPREIFHPEIQKGSVNFKFGILYAKDGQLTDDEMFSNGLKIFATFFRNIIPNAENIKMFVRMRHPSISVKVERKRHIGNDIVTIVFQEGEESSPAFKPSMIRSHFTLINGEKATLETPTFSQKRQRTLDMLIRSLYQDMMPDLHKNMLNRRSFSDVLPESPKSTRKKEEARQAEFVRLGQPWESQSFCSNFPHEVVCADSWGQSLLVSTDVGILLIDGCHLYAINTHHGSELRIVVAIRNKLLLVTKKYNPHQSLTSSSVFSSSESPVEEFQYIREICLSDPPVVLTLVDGPTGDSDNLICVAYRHQFDLVNESTGESYRLHNIETNKVNFVAAIDVYEDGEAGLLLCYNYVCQYRKVYPFSGGSPLIQPSAYDFHFSWNQVPYAVVCAFPYILAFTTDSIEIRLVVNGNLVHTAVVPELQLVASRSDIYFKASAAVSGSSDSSSKEMSSKSSPQTPTAYEKSECPLSSPEGEVLGRNLYKIPLSNLVGRSIERPLKSPLASKVIPSTTSSVIASLPATHSLSLSRMEIKEIASRTRLLDEPIPKKESAQKQKKVPRRQSDPKQGAVRSTSSDRIISSSFESYSDRRHLSTSSDPDTLANREESSPSSCPLQLISLYDDDIIDLK